MFSHYCKTVFVLFHGGKNLSLIMKFSLNAVKKKKSVLLFFPTSNDIFSLYIIKQFTWMKLKNVCLWAKYVCLLNWGQIREIRPKTLVMVKEPSQTFFMFMTFQPDSSLSTVCDQLCSLLHIHVFQLSDFLMLIGFKLVKPYYWSLT